jgi:hypothetical protein
MQLVFSETVTNLMTPVVVVLSLVWIGYVFRSWWQGKISSLAALCWVTLVTYLVHPRGVAYEQITFLIPFLIWMFTPEQTPTKSHRPIAWIIAIAASWLGFYGSYYASGYYALPEWILAFYIIWMVVYLKFWHKADLYSLKTMTPPINTVG